MPLKPLNSIDGFSAGAAGNVVVFANLDIAGNTITANVNLNVAGVSNLNQVSNVRILGGSNGQALITNGNGNLSFTSLYEINPVFTYNVDKQVTRIDYTGGNYKLFTYNLAGQLTRLDYIRGPITIRKDFTYNLNGTLNNIVQTEF